MVKIKNNLYLTDEYLYVGNKKKQTVTKFSLPKNIVINGKVANIDKFINVLEKIVKENNLNNSLIGDNIKIIVSPKYSNAEITLLKNIFEKLNFRKIIIEHESKYYKLNQNKAYLNILNGYSTLCFINDYAKKEIYLIPEDFFIFKNLDNLDFFQEFVKNKIANRDLYLIGNGKNLVSFYQTFEQKYQNITYLYANSKTFIMDNVINL